MNDDSKKFLNKIKISTYIYTFTFMAVSILYVLRFSGGTEAVMLLIAAFAFYSLGRQINLVAEIESGSKPDTKPRSPVWVRGVTWFVVMMLALSVILSW